GPLPHLRPPRPAEETTMVLDPFTQRSLELLAPLRPESQLTVFSVLNRTKTPMGRRLLRRWLLSPLRDRKAIEARLDAVEALMAAAAWEPLGDLLRRTCDLPRLLGRVGTGSLRPVDLVALRRSLEVVPQLELQLQSLAESLPERLSLLQGALAAAPAGLREEIQRALMEAPPPDPKEGGLIKPGYSETLDRLRQEIHSLRKRIVQLEQKERARTGISTLKVGYNRVLGYFLEVTKPHLQKVPPEWRRRQSLSTSERFVTPELEGLAHRLTQAEEEARALEQELFFKLCAKVKEELSALARLGEALAELDVLRSLAEVAHRGGYSRPRFTQRPLLRIREGRHPVVETVTDFVPNDLEMGEEVHLAVVTGPNMAGKSVFLRQVALIALLAQMGSFVPAKEAELPILDRIYTRVGASDALAGGLSTFMAEMNEAAQIISGATPRSLVILDELGRGTSTHDGLALAWAIARHLAQSIRCKTLFATHFRELARLADEIPGVINLHVAVREWQGEVIFLHQVQPGVAERAYGVEVAKLAQLPPPVLEEAEHKLAQLEREAPLPRQPSQQLPLFGPEEHPVVAELRKLSPEELTPLQALEVLFRLKDLVERDKKKP
ncbi:MAG TPA: DNA mismatch repair protein MutS, partial [Candidatus Acetothermia bacterium]|nr:DNA mismatch repair protein MutS [Candidatus Acetothermia bacterium]